MKCLGACAVGFTLLVGDAFAAEIYTDYDSFYAEQPGSVFVDPIEFDRGVVYATPGEQGVFTEMRSELDGVPVNIVVAANRISINGRKYRFARAVTFPGESASEISPSSASVFLAPHKGARPAALCLQGFSNGSGEASRYAQVYLLIDPLKHATRQKLLHLPSLLASCRAVTEASGGKLAFPRNSYKMDGQRSSRVGLTLTYHTFGGHRFVTTGTEIHVRFEQPDLPYRFSVVTGAH
jgi:hypothetical protein